MKENPLKSAATTIGFTRWQIFFAQLTLIALIALTLFTFNASKVSAKQSEILDVAQSSTPAVIDVQHGALHYVIEVQSWMRGLTSKRDVESARALLDKSLNTFNSAGLSMSSLVDPLFLRILYSTDGVIQKLPQGPLPLQLQARTKAAIGLDMNRINNYSEELVISFQRNIEVSLRTVTAERERFTAKILVIRYGFLLMLLTLVFWVGRTFSAQYKSIRGSIKAQVDELALSRAELGVSQLAITELKILDEEKNDFISSINHELRTPLTSIIGYLGLVSDLTDEKSSPQTAKFLKIVDRNLSLLLDLVEDMLTISKLDAGASSQTYHRVILDELIADAIFVLQPLLDEAAISIEFAAGNSLDDWSIAGNKGQISQVFINLIGNSVKFSPRNSKIHIGISTVLDESGAKFIRVSVSDQGIGIPAEDIKRLFDRFFRSKNAVSGQIPGTGLGLAIVKKIIEQHGGRINIESEINKGTSVHIELPVFVSGIDQLVLERRLPVLEKAIESMTNAPLDQLRAVAHEMGGAISFYTFESEGAELINFSHWLAVSPDLTEDEIIAKRNEILISLRLTQLKIELGLSH